MSSAETASAVVPSRGTTRALAPNRAARAVVDAKYKAERPGGFPDADLYQMLAYCTALRLRVGHLVYAKGNEPRRAHHIQGTDVTIHAHALDLDQPPAGLLAALDALAQTIADAAENQRAEPAG